MTIQTISNKLKQFQTTTYLWQNSSSEQQMVATKKEYEQKQDVVYLQLTLPNGGFTDDQFYEFCQLNDNLKIERNAKGEIIIMALTGGKTGNLNFEFNVEFGIWNRKQKRGISFDSSTGFRLPNKATYSPDVAWITKERWQSLTSTQQDKFVPLCPDFVVEILSLSQPLPLLEAKMEEFMENGCLLGWLIDPYEKTTHVYRPKVETEKVTFDSPLYGGQVQEGFVVTISDLFSE
jgi:Uma2 family endonuclease